MKAYRYLHLDVFTDCRFGGNQLAVFLEPKGLDAGLMQAIACEMAFSETTFVFPPEDAQTDFRVRIFTPGAEIPMAGHPTIGTAFALAQDRRVGPGRNEVVFGEGIGPVPVSLDWGQHGLAFAWMTQLLPTFGDPLPEVTALAAALGVEPDEIRAPGTPVQEVSCGLAFLLVPLATRAAVDRAVLDRAGYARFCRSAGIRELPLFFFSTEAAGDGATAYSRMFAPELGVAEDPATGSASGPLGAYLVRHRVVAAPDAGRILSLQGVVMGRPSRIHIAIELHGGKISRVRVGGEAVLVGEGTILC